jgi:hypothetical protein
MHRRLPSEEDALRILATKRTRRTPRPPPAVGGSLAPLIRSLDERFGKGPDGLRARWREIVGEALALRTEPVKLTRPRQGDGGGVLELKVDGPAAALIQHQAPEILARVNLFMGAGTVARLRVVQGPVRRGAPPAVTRSADARRRRAQPLDAAAEAELDAGLSRMADGPLKTALRRLGREVLRRPD